MKCEKQDNVDTTTITRQSGTRTECDITGRKRKKRCLPSEWHRTCEKCGRKIYYAAKGNLTSSLKQGRRFCQSCVCTKRDPAILYKRKCPKCQKELIYSCWTTYNRQNRKNSLCRSCNQVDKKLIGPFFRVCPTCHKQIQCKDNRAVTRATKANQQCLSCSISKKNRFRHQRDRERYGTVVVPCFNRKACQYFDELNRKRGWHLIHAMNGGEQQILGYWLDAYDKERNVVVEYDESHHFTKTGSLRKKDVDRMNEICEHLHCDFWRYNEKTNTLQRYENQSRTISISCNKIR
jgi:hypothetical protein